MPGQRVQDDETFGTLVGPSEEGKNVLASSWSAINGQNCVADVDFLGHTSRCAGKEIAHCTALNHDACAPPTSHVTLIYKRTAEPEQPGPSAKNPCTCTYAIYAPTVEAVRECVAWLAQIMFS
jgi:hypothetical protein